ncbi:PRC-barrel domain-containing protein [Paenibacillus doosanensis]|uniref:PRC-barrel domain protein n=1 Tax=Paenibacillus konkukensis TaxID=2020716 RepID=A0ABY4RK87_9BACL|nr:MULTISPECIES: PRC-barrel domain-containing protein [Paenibacillus]MCS7462634.1 PRC-barrel domain-containing protein [Paenibacillus doosanensis]UQZ82545.1 PRC-barrel domain protein [Paenibacillus konkukensis]
MKRARDVIGLPVFCVQTGKQVGIAKDLLLGDAWHLEAVLLETKSWFASPSCIMWKDVIALGDDAITIANEEVISRMEDEGEAFTSLLNGDRKLKGMPVLTVNGQQLGIVDDVYLDPNKGKKVIGYELTEGFISDLKEGRKWLPLPETVTVGEDAIIVPVHCNDTLEESYIPIEE